MAQGRYMFIRKGGKAIHQLADISRDELDAELIVIFEEDEENYIGRFVEGYGFCNVRFRKSDCRVASDEESQLWLSGHQENIKF